MSRRDDIDCKSLASCDIADGMLITGTADGGELPYLNQQSGPSMTVSGAAYTVEFAPKSDPRPAVSGHYIDSVPSGAILVIATSPECHTEWAPFTKVSQSLYGGLMSTRARFLGAKGTVVLGLVRDLEEHTKLQYPVFSYGLGACAANKTMKVVNVNKPLTVGPNKVVHPGDIIYADASGVVAVPRNAHSAVVEAAALRWKANQLTSEDIEGGTDCQTAQKVRRDQYR